jgi:DNA-binding MarR family transcriptional regulator
MNYTDFVVAKSAPKSKSAMDKLIDSVTRLRAEARERMSEEEFRQVEEKFHQLANKSALLAKVNAKLHNQCL